MARCCGGFLPKGQRGEVEIGYYMAFGPAGTIAGWPIPGSRSRVELGPWSEGRELSSSWFRNQQRSIDQFLTLNGKLKPPLGPLLVADWAPADAEGDEMLFVFDGGELAPEHRDRIELDPAEIAAYAFHDPELVDTLLIPRFASRVRAAIEARSQATTLYLEHGKTHRGALPN